METWANPRAKQSHTSCKGVGGGCVWHQQQIKKILTTGDSGSSTSSSRLSFVALAEQSLWTLTWVDGSCPLDLHVSSKHLLADFIGPLCPLPSPWILFHIRSLLDSGVESLLGLLTCFPLSLFRGIKYVGNIFCHTKRLAANRSKTEKFFVTVQIRHVLVAHLALQKRSYKLWKKVMK